jgi:hypothetical protein
MAPAMTGEELLARLMQVLADTGPENADLAEGVRSGRMRVLTALQFALERAGVK